MRKGKNAILFYIRSILIIITVIFAIIPTYSCESQPQKYAETIKLYSRMYGVDPALVFAVCETESHFNPQAYSPMGAVGIMQIMPETGEWLATRLSFENYSNDELYNANTNIRFGTYYLSYLQTLFEEDWQVIASYNAGEGKVRDWLSEEGFTKEQIPIAETANYLAKVEKAIMRYRKKKYAAFD